MKRTRRRAILSKLRLALLLAAPAALMAASRDLGGGFVDHGVATPLSQSRGMVATVDGEGRDVMLVWLYDHRGGYALLMIDALTGKSEQFATPYPWSGDGPFASMLSGRNKYYSHFGSHFVEFDPVKRAFTYFRKATPQMAMSMTEADDGTIWSVTYPNSGLVSFNPETRAFRDYGAINQENWRQYPRSIAVDEAGWVYVGLGATAAQIVAIDPQSGATRAVLSGADRRNGHAMVYRDLDGKVYSQIPGDATGAGYALYRGEAARIGPRTEIRRKPIIAGAQDIFHSSFPSGRHARSCDTVARQLVVEDPKTGKAETVAFDYTSEGAHLVAVARAPDGTLAGGTMFPMRQFAYRAQSDTWFNEPAHGQFNTVVRQGDRFFMGGYPRGFLLEWDPAAAWQRTVKGQATSNPRFFSECTPTIHRPHELLAHPDGHTLVLAGTPGYGYTGGGLLFWDRTTGQRTLLEHTALLPEHSTMSLVALGTGEKLLGGTTTAGGTGGETKAKEAELYLLDFATKRIEWRAPLLKGAQSYTDLWVAPNGLVFGFSDRTKFFVFDPAKREIVHTEDVAARFGGVVTGQGPRAFVAGDDSRVFVIFTRGIAELDPAKRSLTWLASSPVPIGAGGDVAEGRVYFAGGSHLYSYRLPQ